MKIQEENDFKSCYLITSNAFTDDELKEYIEEDDMENWENYFTEVSSAELNFKEGVRHLMIPYKISIMKTLMNYDYFVDPHPYLITEPYLHIAPSLKKIKPIQDNIPLGYPHWFALSFPDVLFWAMSETNESYIFDIINKYPEEFITSTRYLDSIILKDIIELYLETTKKKLECRKYIWKL